MLKRGEITERVARFLVTEEPRTAQLYLLPKVHKNVTPVPGRPIVSANESPTERVSAFVDIFLAPIVKTGRSYILDTSDFLLKLQDIRDLRGNELLLTLDPKRRGYDGDPKSTAQDTTGRHPTKQSVLC